MTELDDAGKLAIAHTEQKYRDAKAEVDVRKEYRASLAALSDEDLDKLVTSLEAMTGR